MGNSYLDEADAFINNVISKTEGALKESLENYKAMVDQVFSSYDAEVKKFKKKIPNGEELKGKIPNAQEMNEIVDEVEAAAKSSYNDFKNKERDAPSRLAEAREKIVSGIITEGDADFSPLSTVL